MGMLGLKIDVDTYWGMRNGVPRLLRTLRDFHIQGTFFKHWTGQLGTGDAAAH